MRQSTITIDRLVDYAKQNGITSIIITDYNTLGGTAKIMRLCAKNEIKASVGLKIQIDYKGYTGYVTLIAKNYEGFIALCKILRDGYNNQTKGIPIISFDILKKHCGYGTSGHNNLIITTCGMDGLLFTMISENDILAFDLMTHFITIFGMIWNE